MSASFDSSPLLSWQFLLGPGVIYTVERIYRDFWQKRATLKVVKGVVLPGGVVHVQVTKPPGWKCKPGMYVFLQVRHDCRMCPHSVH